MMAKLASINIVLSRQATASDYEDSERGGEGCGEERRGGEKERRTEEKSRVKSYLTS